MGEDVTGVFGIMELVTGGLTKVTDYVNKTRQCILEKTSKPKSEARFLRHLVSLYDVIFLPGLSSNDLRIRITDLTSTNFGICIKSTNFTAE